MAKQIKKLFLKKISSILGIFIVCGFSLTLGAILLRVAYSAFTQPTLPPDAGTELGSLVGKIGINSDAPSINSTLFAGQQAIYDLVNTKCGGVPPPPVGCIQNLSAGSYGYQSIAVGIDGFPIISYLDFNNKDLKVIHCTTRSCSVWSTPVVLDSLGDVGEYSSIAIGNDSYPIISYWDATNDRLKVVHCTAIDCSTFNPPVIPDFGISGGAYTSIAIAADGLPIISYYRVGDLRIVHCESVSCTSLDMGKTVDAGGGMYNSIAIGFDTYPIISYWDQSNTNLKVVHCSSKTCNTNDPPRTLDSTGDVGEYSSIAIASTGFPIISYYDATNADLKVVYCTSVDCSANIFRTLDSTGTVGLYTSMTIGSDNLPIIFYSGWMLGLKIIHCTSADCSSADIPDFVDNSNNTTYTAITVGVDGFPVMTYRDNNLELQRVLKCDDRTCSSCSL